MVIKSLVVIFRVQCFNRQGPKMYTSSLGLTALFYLVLSAALSEYLSRQYKTCPSTHL
jgi:hypothetical protein